MVAVLFWDSGYATDPSNICNAFLDELKKQIEDLYSMVNSLMNQKEDLEQQVEELLSEKVSLREDVVFLLNKFKLKS